MKKLLLLIVLIATAPALAADSPVILNTQTLIYHQPQCKWAQRCTKNCIKTTKKQAQAAEARPCKVCGG